MTEWALARVRIPGGDRIEIRDLRLVGTHGALPEERERAQPFSVDVVAWVDMAAAQRSDALADTVDYGSLAALVAEVVGGRSYQLLEALAGRLADALLGTDPRLLTVEVTVRKLRPPLALDVASTGVRVSRSRSRRALRGDGRHGADGAPGLSRARVQPGGPAGRPAPGRVPPGG